MTIKSTDDLALEAMESCMGNPVIYPAIRAAMFASMSEYAARELAANAVALGVRS